LFGRVPSSGMQKFEISLIVQQQNRLVRISIHQYRVKK
jgi:hypothetical protein